MPPESETLVSARSEADSSAWRSATLFRKLSDVLASVVPHQSPDMGREVASGTAATPRARANSFMFGVGAG